MAVLNFPVIDPVATGQNIVRLRTQRGLTVRDLQHWFNFEEPRAIYKWQSGKTLPTVDNLYALSALLGVSMNDILVEANLTPFAGSQVRACEPALFLAQKEHPCRKTGVLESVYGTMMKGISCACA